MTQYATNSDFSTDAAGTVASANATAAITGWSWLQPPNSGNFWKATTTAGGTLGTDFVRFSDSGWGSAPVFLAFAAPGQIAANTETDWLIHFRVGVLAANTALVHLRDPNVSPFHYYSLVVDASGDVQLQRWLGGNPDAGIGTNIAKGLAANTWYWARVHVTAAGAWSWRVWAGAFSSEPGTWDVSGVTDTTSNSGYCGVGLYTDSALPVDFDWFSVGTGTDLAPTLQGPAAALAGAASDVSSASGTLQSDFAATAVDVSSAIGNLYKFPSAVVTSVAQGSGVLTTAILAAATATSLASAAASLTNWSTVVLANPLYSGAGSILDANGTWSAGAPGAGDTIFYDGTYLTIETDGEIVATSNSFSALCQWDNGGTWSYLTVIVTPGLVSYPASTAALIGAISTGIVLASAASDLSTAAASLVTQIKTSGSIQTLSVGVANLSTAIQVAANALENTVGSATLVGSLNALTGAPTDDAEGSAVINTQILMLSAAVDVAQAAGALATQIILAANAVSVSSAIGTLQTQIPVGGAAMAVSSASAVLSTGTNLGAAALAVTNAAAQLLTAIRDVGAAIDTTSLQGSLTVGSLFSAAATTVSTATAALTTLIELAASAQSNSVASGSLSTGTNFQGAGTDATTAAGALTTRTQLAGAAADDTVLSASAAGSGAKLAGSAQDQSTAGASLSTAIDPDVAAADESAATGALGVAGSGYIHPDVMLIAPPEGFWPADGLLPWGLRFQRVGEMLIYAIDWSEWLANRWLPRARVVSGDVVRPTRGGNLQFTCVTGGYTGRDEPGWPCGIGAQVLDGGIVVWQAEALDDESLAATIEQSTWAPSAPAIGVTSPRVANETTALASIDTTLAVVGTDYDVSNAIQTTDGRQKVGKFRIKVR